MFGPQTLEFGSTTALSSGDGLVRSSVHALGIKAIMSDWCNGVNYEIHMLCGCSAVRGISGRRIERNPSH